MPSTIDVTGTYTVGKSEDLHFFGEPGFNFMAGDTPPELINAGQVLVRGRSSDVTGVVTDNNAWGAAGARVILREGSNFQVRSIEQGATGFMLGMDDVRFSNAGSVKVSGATFSIGLDMEGFSNVFSNAGTFEVVSHTASGGMTLGGASRLVNTGDILVTAATEGGYGVIQYGGSHFQNSGLVKVSCQLSAIALQMSPNGVVDNDGRVMALSKASGAVGLTMWDTGTLHNSGELIVKSYEPAIGVNLGGAADIVNDGLISAASSGDVGRSIGIWTADGEVSIANAGVLKADDAILVQGNLTGVSVDNAGLIAGDVTLGDGDDLMSNAGGVIRGHVLLGAGDDSFDGRAGRLFGDIGGGDGDDVISLGRTDDHITGGAGSDTLSGGAGSDVFVYADVSESAGTGADLITDLDFRGDADVIDLSAIDADSGRDGNQAFHLSAHLTGKAGQLAVRYDAAHDLTLVLGDVDGDGRADLRIELQGDHSGFDGFVL